MNSLQKLLGQTAVYGLSSIVGRFLNYLLVPLHTKVFFPEQYGVITELYAEVAFLNILFTFGLETTFFRFSTKNPEKRQYYFNITQTIIFCISILISSIIIIFSQDISELIEYPQYQYIIRWLGLILAIDAIVAIPFAKLRLQGKALKFASFKISNIGVNLLLNLFFLMILPLYGENYEWLPAYDEKMGIGYVFLANLIANSCYLLFFFRDLLKYTPVFNFTKWKPVLNYAWPIVIIGFAGVTNEMFSRVMLKYLLPEDFYPGISNQAALGIFGACYKLSIFMALTVQAFKYAYEPFFFKESTKENSDKVYVDVMHAFVFLGTAAWVGITMILPELAPIFISNEVYLSGLDVVPILLGAGLLLGVYYNLSVWYKVTDKTIAGAILSILGMIITVVLNFLLIPVLGFHGSAWTTLITYMIMVLSSYFWGNKVYKVNYKATSFMLVFTSGLIISIYLIGLSDDIMIRYLVGSLTVIAYLSIYFLPLIKSNRI